MIRWLKLGSRQALLDLPEGYVEVAVEIAQQEAREARAAARQRRR